MRLTTTCPEETNINSYHNSHTIGIFSDIVNYEKVMKTGVFAPDMAHLVNFWGTPKIKKFINIAIKVYEDEICNASVWYH